MAPREPKPPPLWPTPAARSGTPGGGWSILTAATKSPVFLPPARSPASFSPAPTRRFVADAPLRRLYLKLALTDPITPEPFMSDLAAAYERGVRGSADAPASPLGRADQAAKAICSIVAACEPEFLAASQRPGWGAASSILADAQELLLFHKKPSAKLNPDALRNSLTEEQTSRLRSLSSLARQGWKDEGLLLAGLEASPWLKEQPAFACLSIYKYPSVVAACFSAGYAASLAWLERAGADLWLASAQDGQPDACAWAVGRLHQLPRDADLAPIARMLLRGAWLDGAPEPKARCVKLASAAADQLALRARAASEEARARSLISIMETMAIEEIIPAASGSPKTARRGAL